MKSSGNTTRSAPSAAAFARPARALVALPSTSPTVGLSWASVILKSAARSFMTYTHFIHKYGAPTVGLQLPSLDRAYAFGDGKQPKQGADDQRHAHRGRTQILHPPDLRIVISGQAVGELLDGGVQQLNDQHQQHHGDQLDPAHQGRPAQPGH